MLQCTRRYIFLFELVFSLFLNKYPKVGLLYHMRVLFLTYFLKKKCILTWQFFIAFRERGRERKKYQCNREALIGCLLDVPRQGIGTQIRDWSCTLGIYPDQELNLQYFGYGMMLQPTERHRPGLCLIFWRTSIPFSIVAVPIYIPTNSIQGFRFLHILINICYFFSFWQKPP